MPSSGEDAGKNGGPQATVLSNVALRRLRMRPFFMRRPDLLAFRQYLGTLAHPSLCLDGTVKEGEGHLAPSRLDRARLALRQLGVAIERRWLASKELLFSQPKRRAARCLRDDLWRWGIGEVKKTAKQREWGKVPAEVARLPWSVGGTGRTLVSTCHDSGTSGLSLCSSSSRIEMGCTSTSSRRSETTSGRPGTRGGIPSTPISLSIGLHISPLT